MIIENNAPLSEDSHRLRELVRELGLPLRRLPEVLSAKPEQCLAWWSLNDPKIKIDESNFAKLAGLVGINETQLYVGDFDRELARKRILGDHHSLPPRYLQGQNSYLRTSEHIFRYIVLTRGQWFADQVLSSLNVSPLIYQNTNQLINLTYFADLLETLAQKGFSANELDTLASVIFLSLQETPLGQRFEESENFFDVYSTLSGNFNYFDSNFEYHSTFFGKNYVLKTVLPLGEHQDLRNSPQALERLLRYRHILLAWFPYLAGMTPLFPTTEVIRKSDSIEVYYKMNLNSATRPHSSYES